MSEEKKYYNPQEICSILGISYPTFIRHIKSGDIPHFKVGIQIRVPNSYLIGLEESAGK